MKFNNNTTHQKLSKKSFRSFLGGFAKIDFSIFLIYITFILLSIVLIYSVSTSFSLKISSNPNFLFHRHLLGIVLALMALFVGFYTPLRFFQKIHIFIVIALIFTLLLPFIPGIVNTATGTKRWISILGLNLQPSDLTKMLIVFYLAKQFSYEKSNLTDGNILDKKNIGILLFSFLCGISILAQKDFSSSILFFFTVASMLYIAGFDFKLLIYIGILLGLVLVPFILSSPYRLERISMLWNFQENPKSAYQIYQSLKAFHVAGFLGNGPNNYTHTIPYVYNDFIFAALAQEFGFIGGFLAIVFFAILMIRGFKIAKSLQTVNPYASFIVFGFIINITFQAIINMSVNMALVFPTGISLPFLSYGRTSLIIYSFCIGLILQISKYSQSSPKKYF